MAITIHVGDALEVLRGLPSESVQCVVTSPPYFSLRAYNTDPKVWGGDPEHGHEWQNTSRRVALPPQSENSTLSRHGPDGRSPALAEVAKMDGVHETGICPCGAWRGELGLEPTPAMFIEHLVAVFDEVKRVMRNDATLWVNLGDSYSGSGKGPTGKNGIQNAETRQGFESGYWSTCRCLNQKRLPDDSTCIWCNGDGRILRKGGRKSKTEGTAGIPAKNLLLIPQRFAIAMQDAGWWVRSEIVWAKTSAMPESVRDRPTRSWEPIWMFAKSRTYYYDAEAVKVPATSFGRQHSTGVQPPKVRALVEDGTHRAGGDLSINYERQTANLRNVWPTKKPVLRLRSDLTPEQRAYVLRRLADGIDPGGHV